MAEKRVGGFEGEDVFVCKPERVEMLPKGDNIAGRSGNIEGEVFDLVYAVAGVTRK